MQNVPYVHPDVETITFDEAPLAALTPIKVYASGIYDEEGYLIALEGALYIVSLLTGSVTPVTPENLGYVWRTTALRQQDPGLLTAILDRITAWDEALNAGQLTFWATA